MEEPVGIRELRQNLSVYLRRVAAGDRFVVTDHRRPVAVLGPLPERAGTLERLIAQGRLSRPSGDLLDLPPPTIAAPHLGKTEDVIDEQRAEKLP
ncbi:MAG TPA: type II toxin-antitoxin system prevent-host-death family antitoxin [Solirubrobacteraceae bacterium]|jgi:prevent-host-death family protein